MKINKKDVITALVIGAGVGLLLQPVISNFGTSIQNRVLIPLIVLRLIVFAGAVIGFPLAIGLINWIVPALYQFGKFASVGVLNTTIDLGVFNLETFLYAALPGTGLFAVLKSISFLTATTNSFFWNKHWTFEARTTYERNETVRFYGVAIVGGLLNVGVATAARTVGVGTFIPEKMLVNLVAPACGILSAFLWDFFGYKYFVFKKVDAGS